MAKLGRVSNTEKDVNISLPGAQRQYITALDALRAVTEESYLCIPEGLRYTMEDAIATEEKRQRVIEQMVEALREAEEWLSEHRGGRGDQVRESARATLAAWDVLNQRKKGE